MPTLIARGSAAKPFVKWAGGKGYLLPELLQHLPAEFGRYHEPFVGAGALFFELATSNRLRHGAALSDLNAELISCYQVVRDDVEALIDTLRLHEAHKFDREYFYLVRGWDREPGFAARPAVERAARTIFLNRTCFNGLYRVNRKGFFNVSYGRYANPRVCDPDMLHAAARALRGVELRAEDFAAVAERARPGDLIYCDPPYVPLSATSSFTSYTAFPFNDDTQLRLAKLFHELAERGCSLLLSNSATPLIRHLYAPFAASMRSVHAPRRINCNGQRRGNIEELIIAHDAHTSAQQRIRRRAAQ
jgi:DNA adenine methylase